MSAELSPGTRPKVGMVSLGCAKNLIDSEVMLGLLQKENMELTNNPGEADVIVVNTCTFISSATSESVETLLEMSQYKKRGRCRALVLAGCMGTRYRDQLLAELPEVDAVIGTGEVAQIGQVVRRVLAGERFTSVARPQFIYNHEMPRLLATRRHTAFVKISEGCNHQCAFCIIPQVRGAQRSRPMESVVAEARHLVENGTKEIVVIAQDTTWYGRDNYGEFRLAQLLQQLAGVDGLQWLRLLYAYPTHLSDDVLKVMAAHENICKYVELPLQHVSNHMLRAMHREGDRNYIERLVDKVRTVIPDVALRTSFIVGFPGETEDDFQELCEFVEAKRFIHVGVFTYSPEEGTPAATLPDQVPEHVKEERRRIVMQMQRKISRQTNEGLVGCTAEVLIDKAENGAWIGRTRWQAPEIDGITRIRGNNLRVGDIIQARISGASDYDLTAIVE